jgi:hypothetical protein
VIERRAQIMADVCVAGMGFGHELVSLCHMLFDLLKQAGKIDGFGVEIIAACFKRFGTFTIHGMGGERDDRDRLGAGFRTNGAGGLPAVEYGQTHVHQNQIGVLGFRHGNAFTAIDGQNDLVPFFCTASREHIPVHFVVFDQ